MKKFYLRFLKDFFTGDNGLSMPVKSLLLAITLSSISYAGFGQVVVTPANDSVICSKTAVNGFAPSCTTLGVITISETVNSDFAASPDNITLVPPPGWQFCTGTPPTITASPGGDIAAGAVPFALTTASLSINPTAGGIVFHDQITITGLQVQPLTTAAPTGNITASSTSGVSGIVIGTTSFGRLGIIPAPIVGMSPICTGAGGCVTFVDPTPGGSWTSSNPLIATVTGAGGSVCGVASGIATITYTVAGCAAVYPVTVNIGPGPIVGPHNMCAWFDSLHVTDVTTGGLYSSTHLTATNPGGGASEIYAHMPGVDSLIYTLPNGCSVMAIITVNPLPRPFDTPPYEVCMGSTKTLSDSIGPGTWTSSNTFVATIGSSTGVVSGLHVGTTRITYTLSGTGCKTDTLFTVNPIPGIISGPTEVCVLSTITLTDTPTTGTWTCTPPSATIDPTTGVLTGVSPGTTVVLYTLPITGCATLTTVTVDPLPSYITGPTSLCVGSTITLFDSVAGGVWMSMDTTVASVDPVTGVVTGRGAGTVFIHYTIMPGNCFRSYTVTVNALPPMFIGPRHLCAGGVGSAITLIETDTTGVWSSSNTSVAIIYSTGVVTGVAPGFSVICFTDTITGCQICDTIFVDLTPNPIVGPSGVCQGDTITLTVSDTGGVWTSSDPARANVFQVDSVHAIVVGYIASTFPVYINYTIGACFTTFALTVYPNPSAISGPSSLCQGDTVTYTDTLSGGTWTSSIPTTGSIDPVTGFFTALASGSVVITYTSPHGCATSFAIIIGARAPIVGPNTVCQNSTITLTNANVGGTWSASDTTIISINDLGFGTLNVTGLAGGVDTIKYDFGGCISTFIITVNPIAPIVASPSSVCKGSLGIVSDSTPGGIWTSSNPAIGSIDSLAGVIYGVDTGVITVTYTITATGCFATALFTVTPIPDPITGPTEVCRFDSVQLMETSTGGTWSASNGNATVNASTGWVTGVLPGLDTIFYSFPGTGCKVSFEIIINPKSPILGPDSVCVGYTITLSDTTSGGTWSNAFPLFGSIDASGHYTGLSAGVDTVYYTTPAECQSKLVITVNPVPVPITGPDSVCVNAQITLSDASGPGTWSSDIPTLAFVGPTTGIVFGIAPGIDSIKYTLFTGGCYIKKGVVVNPTPSAITGPSTVCLGRNITLFEPTPVAGSWWTASDSTITALGGMTIASVNVNGTSLGTDTVTYTYGVGRCKVIHPVTVTPIPTITVNTPRIKCKYDTDTLTATGAGPGAVYTWTPAYGLSGTVGATVYASPTVTTTYTVTGTTAVQCDSYTTVTVLVDDSLNHLLIVGRDSICAGECATLMASGRAGSYFDWHPVVGLSCTICDTTVACPSTTTTYWAVAIDDLGCKDSVSHKLTVNPIPIIRVNPNPTIVCKRSPTQVWMSTTNIDSTDMSWAWSPNLFISCDSCKNPILTDTNNIVYTVIGTSNFGCYDSFKVKVSVLDTNVNTISADTNICTGGIATLVATSHSLYSNLDIPTFTWFPSGDLSWPDSSTTLATPQATTTYSVAIRENVCFSDTLAVTVFVQPYPSLTIYVEPPSTNIVAGTPIQLTAKDAYSQIDTFLWTPPNTLTCDSCYNPIAIPTVNTTYKVTVTSIYHCTSQDSVTITMFCDQSQVFIPNTFTPNGDGVNDQFYISGKGLAKIINLSVYNRWGQLVFENNNFAPNDKSQGWDGTFKGLVLEPDVFVYTVEAECELGGQHFKYKGDISIVK